MLEDLFLDDLQFRTQALDVTKSFIVQAPAGSGKTELLIQRFLTLLNYVQKPEEIIAITFTKKAANEMRARIIKALHDAQLNSLPSSSHAKKTRQLAKQVLLRDQQLHWQLTHNPNQLRIQTIDSFCSFLTEQLPVLTKFGAKPTIASQPLHLYRKAVEEVLNHLEDNVPWSSAIATLLLHVDNDLNKLHDLLISLLVKRDQWIPYLHFSLDDQKIKYQLEQQLKLIINEHLKKISQLFPTDKMEELKAIYYFTTHTLFDLNDKKNWTTAAKILLNKKLTWRTRFDEAIGFPALSSILNPDEKSTHLQFRERLKTLIQTLSEHTALKTALSDLNFLPDPFFTDHQWAILKALLTLLKILVAQLQVTFREHGQIDFIENTQAALLALGAHENPTDLALALDYQIQHILIDEFQDTSLTQYQLLEMLIQGWQENDGHTLFVVGDPMQSIYRFREAEVGLFIRMCRLGIGNLKPLVLNLNVNFRSNTTLVNWNNNHFKKIFPFSSDIATGAVSYASSTAALKSNDDMNAIYLKGFKDDKTQADKISEIIQQIQSQHPEFTIAILVRSRTHLTDIIPALNKAHISYHAKDIDPLLSRQIIQDLLTLTKALLYRTDRIAWLALLRAPWCGLKLNDLLKIAGTKETVIFENLCSSILLNTLSENGQQRVHHVFSILKSQIYEKDKVSLRVLIETTWLLLGGPAVLSKQSEIDDANAFFDFLEDYTQEHEFFDVQKFEEQLMHLYATTQDAKAPLQIMTIHAAKGLEFDAVILPHLEKKMPHDDKTILSWMQQPLSQNQNIFLLSAIHAVGDERNSIYEFIHRQQKLKLQFETDRLLYVAATRAKEQLYLLFNTKLNKDHQIKLDAGSFLEKLWPYIHKTLPIVDNAETLVNDQPTTPRLLKRLGLSWRNPFILSLKNKIGIHHKEAGFSLPNQMSQWIGITTHRVLQQLALHGFQWWTKHSLSHQHDYLAQQLMQQGMNHIQIKEAVEIVHRAITNTLQDDKGCWILSPHRETKTEYSLTSTLNGRVENFIIDRTFVDTAQTRWIIDYKTSSLLKMDLQQFLQQEQMKYQEKMNHYAHVFTSLEERPIRLGLYFPLLPAWIEWQYLSY